MSADSHLIYFKTSSFASLSCLLSCLLAYFTFYSLADIYAVCVGKHCKFIRGKKCYFCTLDNRWIKHICVFAGKLYGRGSTDDKGPVLAWFNCIEAYQKIGKVKIFTSAFLPRYFCDDKSYRFYYNIEFGTFRKFHIQFLLFESFIVDKCLNPTISKASLALNISS